MTGRSSWGRPTIKRKLLRAVKHLSLALLLLAALTVSDGLRLNPAQLVALPYRYSLVQWEVGNLLSKWTHRLVAVLPWSSSPFMSRHELVEEYFRLDQEVYKLRAEIRKAAAQVGGHGDGPVMELKGKLTEVRAAHGRLRNHAEEATEATVSAVLSELGIASWGALDFPPVDIRLSEPPKVLVTSPRERIARLHEALIMADVKVWQSEAMERVLMEDQGRSALVVDVSGIATYPAIVDSRGSLRVVLQTAAHEWLHHYLAFNLRPLGLNIFTSAEMLTINETFADMVGREIGDRAFQMLGGALPTPLAKKGDQSGNDVEDGDVEGEFDFDREMRETRLWVDELLAEGAIDDAETYMEERRKLFVDNGFFIRKLNQAFFAINGTYAEQPESSSPVGGQLREIRDRITDLKSFIYTVSKVSSHDEFLDLLARLRLGN